MHRYTNQDDIIVGMAVNTRMAQQFKAEIGYFVNMVPIRSRFEDRFTFSDLLRRLQSTMMDGLSHCSYPFPLMLEKLKSKEAGSNPIFQVTYAYHDYVKAASFAPLWRMLGLNVENVKALAQEGESDLGVEIFEQEVSLRLHLKYNPEIYTEDTAQAALRITSHFCKKSQETETGLSRIFSPARSRSTAVLVGAALLGACDADVTRPVDRRVTKPEAILFGTSWIRSDLPFAPSAINAAGAVVGTNGTEAVVWQNGVLDTLPHHIQLPGPYAAVDISPNGAIVGSANGHVLYWRTSSSPPNDASAGLSYAVYPTAINDSYTIVGWSFLVYGATSKRFTPTGGWVDIGLGLGFFASDQTIVTSLNANGQAAGYLYRYNRGSSVPLRWGTSGSAVQLPAPIDANSDPSGRGISIDGAGNVFGFTSAGATIWHPDGSTVLVTGLPAPPSLRSDVGRFVGVAYNNNSASTSRSHPSMGRLPGCRTPTRAHRQWSMSTTAG